MDLSLPFKKKTEVPGLYIYMVYVYYKYIITFFFLLTKSR